jgi:transposase-like protein
MPTSLHPKAKAMLHQVWMTETKQEAQKAFDLFLEMFQAKYSRATDCLQADRDVLLAFYDFPTEHWVHIRTTNPIESTFATVRLRESNGLFDDGVQAGSVCRKPLENVKWKSAFKRSSSRN